MMVPLLVAALALFVPAVQSRSPLLFVQSEFLSNDQSIKQSNDRLINEILCPSADAPYQLSKMAPVFFNSRYHTGSYMLSPCQSIEQSMGHCGPFVNQSMCYFSTSGPSQWIGLGSVYLTTWEPVNGDYINGATSTNTDINQSNNQTNNQSIDQSTNHFCDPSTSEVNAVYRCVTGTDTVTVITEPETPTDDCVFIFEVDSSLVCEAESNNQTNGPSYDQSVVWGAVGVAGLAIMMVCLACYIHRRKVHRSIDQSINQSDDQPGLYSNLLAHQLTNQSTHQMISPQHVMSVPTTYTYNPYQSNNQSVYPSINQPFYQPNPNASAPVYYQ